MAPRIVHLEAADLAAQAAWRSLPADQKSSPVVLEALARIPVLLGQLHREHVIHNLEQSGAIARVREL